MTDLPPDYALSPVQRLALLHQPLDRGSLTMTDLLTTTPEYDPVVLPSVETWLRDQAPETFGGGR